MSPPHILLSCAVATLLACSGQNAADDGASDPGATDAGARDGVAASDDAASGTDPDADIQAVFSIDTSVYLETLTLNAAPGGIVLNGLNLGPLTVASIDASELSALNSQALSSSGETMGEVDRQVLAYAYSCAMPAGTSMQLDIGGEPWLFEGALGLAPQWETGPCDQECQEWISACILARTNQFGIPVELSLRGDHPALAVPAEVAEDFTLREGSFYGNIFTTTGSVEGAAYACAGGRGGAIYELTDRFCSALGDGCPIKTVADCNINEFACDTSNPACSSYTACSSWDAQGHPTTCHSEFHVCGQAPAGTPYEHIITAYLRPPVANCGNGICEEGEAESCAADCANHWARSYGSGCHEDSGGLSLSEASGDILLTGRFTGDIDFGGTVHKTSSETDRDLFVASFAADGAPNWSVSLDATGNQAMARSVATDSSGNAIIAGHFSSTTNLGAGDATPGGFSFFLAKYSAAAGAHIWSRIIETDKNLFFSSLASLPNIQVATDSTDGVVIATDFSGTADLGLEGGNPSASSPKDILIARFDADGTLDWHTTVAGSGDEILEALALDSDDNVIIGGKFRTELALGGTTLTAASGFYDAFVAKLSDQGAPLWVRQVSGSEGAKAVHGLAVGESDTVLITGRFRGSTTVTGGAELTSTINTKSGLPSADAFVVKFDAGGALEWTKAFGGGRTDTASHVAWDGTGSYVVSSVISAEVGTTANVEGRMLDTGEFGDIVLIRFAPDGTAESVTQRGSPVTEEPKGLVATASGVIITGEFMGTLRFGGTYLTNAGGSWTDVQPADIFLSLVDYLP